MLVTCDYLELYLRGNFSMSPTADFSFVRHDVGTKIYQKVYTVKYRGVMFGLLMVEPRMSTMKPDSCHFKLENEHLYISGTNSLIVLLCEQSGLRFEGVSRMDIACDFLAFENGYRPQQLIRDYINGDIERKGRELSVFTVNFTGREITGCTFGARASERFGRMYNKTLLQKTQNKPYIDAWHERNGLVGRGDVWRLEFSMRGKEMKKLFRPLALTLGGHAKADIGVKLAVGNEHNLLVHDVLKGIFVAELNSYFSFVRPGTDSNISRRPLVVLLDFSRDTPPPDLIMRIAIKRATHAKNFRYRSAVKTLLSDYYLTKQESYLYVACQFIEKYNLHEIVRNRFPYWLKEFAGWYDDGYDYVSVLDMLETVDTCK
jgi:hypothetical protein